MLHNNSNIVHIYIYNILYIPTLGKSSSPLQCKCTETSTKDVF